MMRSLAIGLLTIAASRATVTADVPPTDELTQAGVQATFEVLRQEYIHKDDLTFERLNRAALEGLLGELKAGAELITTESVTAEEKEPQVHQQMLSDTVAWLRPTTFSAAELPDLVDALRSFADGGATDLVLDLRSAAAPGDFDVAASILDLFLPSGQVLFHLHQFGGRDEEIRLTLRDPVWEAPLLVLIDEETSSVGEAIAAVLQQKKRALLLGTPTRGATVRYRTVPVDEQWMLRYASAELLLDGEVSLFQIGLRPDLEVTQSGDEKAQSNRLIRQQRVRELVHETARPRFNEAALVEGSNPELESYLRRSLGKPSPEDKPAPRDRVLQRAVDLIQSRDQLKTDLVDWKRSPTPAQP